MQSALDSAFSKPFSARETDGLRILCDVRRRVAQDAPFDAAIDRYILPHQLDPVAMIRRAAASVRPGSVIAFHEIAFGYQHQFQTLPTVEVYDKISQSLEHFQVEWR
jgi:hypothetical protein